MRIRLRLLALSTLALAAGTPPQSATAQDEARGIVFAAGVTEEGDAVLEPIATMVEGGFMGFDEDPRSEGYAAFQSRWLRRDARYDVLARGERIGGVTLTRGEAAPESCGGIVAYGALQVRATLPEHWWGLAGEGLPPQPGAPWLRASTAGERRELDRMATALFDANGIDLARYTQGDTAASTLLHHPDARPVLIGQYVLMRGDTVARQASVFFVAEETENGYRPAYAWFDEGREGDAQSRSLIDAADLDGDGQPELVVRNVYYEAWTYTILQRAPERWNAVYHGGGGGC